MAKWTDLQDPEMPITTEDDAVVGRMLGFSVATSEGKASLELHGVLFEVPQLGLSQVRWSSSIPITPGWALVRLEDEPECGG
jgi:hypothetical protein